jgi:hypothetical protein
VACASEDVRLGWPKRSLGSEGIRSGRSLVGEKTFWGGLCVLQMPLLVIELFRGRISCRSKKVDVAEVA